MLFAVVIHDRLHTILAVVAGDRLYPSGFSVALTLHAYSLRRAGRPCPAEVVIARIAAAIGAAAIGLGAPLAEDL